MSNGASVPARTARFLRLIGQYWVGSCRVVAFILTAMLAALILGGVYLQASINEWNAAFFNALEQRAGPRAQALLWQFAGLVLAAGLAMVLTVFVRIALQVRVRQWLTRTIVNQWLENGTCQRLLRLTRGAETPEFRIADDVRLAVDPLVDLSVGLLGSTLIALTFFEVLARVGGSMTIASLGATIPMYFLVGAIVYAIFMSGIASLVGWPLVRWIAHKNHCEGVFRYELTRVRENAGAMAEHGRAAHEHQILSRALEELIRAWRRVMVGQARVAGVGSANAVLVGVFPVILAAPKYISGEMTLGAVMQLATAFVQVQMALNWIVDNFVRFAEWRASANRVGEFIIAMETLGATEARTVRLGEAAGPVDRTAPAEPA